jgi:hypothetical protein
VHRFGDRADQRVTERRALPHEVVGETTQLPGHIDRITGCTARQRRANLPHVGFDH